MLAIVYFTQHFKNYLLGQHFLIIMIHKALVWIYSFKEPDGIAAIQKLGQVNFAIKHRTGTKTPNANCLLCINTEYDEQTAFIFAIAPDALQNRLILTMVYEVSS